jgi:hypothetical protein
MTDIDYIKLRPDRVGWTLIVYTEDGVTEYGIGDAIQFHSEVDRTIGRWLADGPADFHGCEKAPVFGTLHGAPIDDEEDN